MELEIQLTKRQKKKNHMENWRWRPCHVGNTWIGIRVFLNDGRFFILISFLLLVFCLIISPTFRNVDL